MKFFLFFYYLSILVEKKNSICEIFYIVSYVFRCAENEYQLEKLKKNQLLVFLASNCSFQPKSASDRHTVSASHRLKEGKGEGGARESSMRGKWLILSLYLNKDIKVNYFYRSVYFKSCIQIN